VDHPQRALRALTHPRTLRRAVLGSIATVAAPQTICPKCGLTPLPERAEECPRCKEPFGNNPLYKRTQRSSMDDAMGVDVEATSLGGVTDSVTAWPLPTAAVLVLGAIIQVVRASGLIVDVHAPFWLFGVGALDLVLTAMVMGSIGPARQLIFASAILQAAIPFVLGGRQGLALYDYGYLAHALALGVMTAGEPSALRRNVGLVLGVAASGAALGLLAYDPSRNPLPNVTFALPDPGYQLELPGGFSSLGAPELGPHLRLPLDGGKTRNVGLGDPARKLFAVVSFIGDPEGTPDAACMAHLKVVAGGAPEKPLIEKAPNLFGLEGKLYDVRTASGAAGRFACGKVGEQLLALAVVVQDPAPNVARAAFLQVASGLTQR
jgi:hypothetical protein